jgi:hypothetical protein
VSGTRKGDGLTLPRAHAISDPGGRRCAECGDLIDPMDWCSGCQTAQAPCGRPHRRLRKRADAAFCNPDCRSRRRWTYIRDCL